MVILGAQARFEGLGDRKDKPAIGGRMRKLLVFVGATVGGTAGWYAGAIVGIMTAFIVGMIGTGIGMYVGSRVAQSYE
jgi:hypothetical protein